jgi:hypothetical protein
VGDGRQAAAAPSDDGPWVKYSIGYYEPYATSHLTLDADTALHEEVRVAARVLVTALRQQRETLQTPPGLSEPDTRPK